MLIHSLAKEWMEFIQDALFCMGLALKYVRNVQHFNKQGTQQWDNSCHSSLIPISITSGRKVQGPEFPFCRVLCCFSFLCLGCSIPNYVLSLVCDYELDHFVMANLCQAHFFFLFFKSRFVA